MRAWRAVDDAIQAALDNPEMHTWDLARATGLDETLDPEAVHRFVARMEAADAAMRATGHYGPRVEVPADADEQTRLIAFVGRQP